MIEKTEGLKVMAESKRERVVVNRKDGERKDANKQLQEGGAS